MKRFPLLLAILAGAVSAFPLDLHINPGELASRIETLDKGASSLYLIGSIDARDLAALRDLPENFKTLDMKGAEVVEYRGQLPEFPGYSIFPAGMLPDHLLFNSPFTSIALPANITIMGKGVCANSPLLEEAIVGAGTTAISELAFYGCPMLNKITFPTSLESIGTRALAECPNLKTADLSSTRISAIPDRCFAGDASLKSVKLPQAIHSVGSEIFTGTAIEYVNLPNLKEAAPFALADMPALQGVTLNPDADFNIGFLMGNPQLNELTDSPSNVPDLFLANSTGMDVSSVAGKASTIGRYAFARAQIDSLALSPELEYVDLGAFAHAPNINYIDARALESYIPDAHADAFSGINPSNIVLHVTKESEEEWKKHPVWSQFKVESATTGVETVTSGADAIRIQVASRHLAVSAPENITDCHVWLADGTSIWQGNGLGSDISIDLPLPEGQHILIVKVNTSSLSRTVTILTR